MKIQILVGDQVVNTQLVSVEALGRDPSSKELKQLALRAALEDRAVTIAQSLQAKFRIFDVTGKLVENIDDAT